MLIALATSSGRPAHSPRPRYFFKKTCSLAFVGVLHQQTYTLANRHGNLSQHEDVIKPATGNELNEKFEAVTFVGFDVRALVGEEHQQGRGAFFVGPTRPRHHGR